MDLAINEVAMTIGGLFKLGNVSKLNLSTTLITDYYTPPKNTAFELLASYSTEELTEAYLAWTGDSRGNLAIDIKSILAENPTIDIEVPDVNLEMDKWSLAKVSQIVVLDDKYDDQVSKYVESYNILTGKKIRISTKEPPNEYALIVRESETKYAIRHNDKKTYHNNTIDIEHNKELFTNNIYTIYTIVDHYIPDDFNKIYSEENSTHYNSRSNCNRDNLSGKEYIGGFRLNTDSGVYNWLEKYSEFRANVVFNSYNGTSWEQIAINKVWLLKSKNNLYRCVTWLGCGGKAPIWYKTADSEKNATELFTWDKSEIASRIIFRWIAVDASDPIREYSITAPSGEVSIPGNSGSVKINTGSKSTKITYTPKDDVVGDAIVEYCDNPSWPGYVYDTGSFRFTVGRKP